MKNLALIVILSVFLCSCAENSKIAEAKAKYQAETNDRLDQTQSSTDGLFKDMSN